MRTGRFEYGLYHLVGLYLMFDIFVDALRGENTEFVKLLYVGVHALQGAYACKKTVMRYHAERRFVEPVAEPGPDIRFDFVVDGLVKYAYRGIDFYGETAHALAVGDVFLHFGSGVYVHAVILV